jgi:hypothetical protein
MGPTDFHLYQANAGVRAGGLYSDSAGGNCADHWDTEPTFQQRMPSTARASYAAWTSYPVRDSYFAASGGRMACSPPEQAKHHASPAFKDATPASQSDSLSGGDLPHRDGPLCASQVRSHSAALNKHTC